MNDSPEATWSLSELRQAIQWELSMLTLLSTPASFFIEQVHEAHHRYSHVEMNHAETLRLYRQVNCLVAAARLELLSTPRTTRLTN